MTLGVFDISGNIALVNGAGSGIGECVALALAVEGASVAIYARTASTQEETSVALRYCEGHL